MLELPQQEAILTSTHNLCFGAKIRKICIPQVVFKGVYISRTCFPDVISWEREYYSTRFSEKTCSSVLYYINIHVSKSGWMILG